MSDRLREAVQIEGFEIRREIASGGFATVYQAVQVDLNRDVAVKVLHAGVLTEAQQVLFERECQVWGNLSQQPGIVTVHQVARTAGGQQALVMQLCDGTLRDRPGLDLQNIIVVGIQAAEALQRIHDYRVVHRDIKPHNIFVEFGGRSVSIGDFGISSIVDERTLTGGAALSVDYAAPEAFSTGGSGQSGDIYSLGATLYYMIAGEVPFPVKAEGRARFAAAGMRIIQDPPPHLPATAPESLDLLLQQTLAKSPGARPATAKALAEQLRVVQREVGAPRHPLPALDLVNSSAAVSHQPIRLAGGDQRRAEPSVAMPLEGTLVRPDSYRVENGRESDETPSEPQALGRGRSPSIGLVAKVVTALVTLGFATWLIGNDGGDERPNSDNGVTGPATTSSAASVGDRFVILVPPAAVSASETAPGRYRIEWEPVGDDLSYQISLLGTEESVIAERSPFLWEIEVETTAACFEIRTVDPAMSRMSQAASAPTCAV